MDAFTGLVNNKYCLFIFFLRFFTVYLVTSVLPSVLSVASAKTQTASELGRSLSQPHLSLPCRGLTRAIFQIGKTLLGPGICLPFTTSFFISITLCALHLKHDAVVPVSLSPCISLSFWLLIAQVV